MSRGVVLSVARGVVAELSWIELVWLAVGIAMVCVIAIGPLVAPNPPNALVGTPFEAPSTEFPLGTDSLGRDVFSRVLAGGFRIVALALIATALSYLLGAALGLLAGYARGRTDGLLMRAMDLLLAFPPLLFLLLLAAGLGPGFVTLIVGVVLVNIPGIARLVRASALEITVRSYVEAAVARGERTEAVLRREILPNVAGTLVADGGLRFTTAFLAIAGLSFLGLGLQPPNPDWASMVAESASWISLQPWAVAGPAACIALLTMAVNVLGDAAARRSSAISTMVQDASNADRGTS